ncbi:hypothetical protein F511_15412 [Dorcoceras hygrometricum]|uniref:Uncharacterized protein n=1 Tax=Dorcoceras hygrometricum TaxID=472368 RepID=A0A2Z7BQR4_9LAMI|nr:hypothetical protein F511_15412 [Dorcoceras hygrometricum]
MKLCELDQIGCKLTDEPCAVFSRAGHIDSSAARSFGDNNVEANNLGISLYEHLDRGATPFCDSRFGTTGDVYQWNSGLRCDVILKEVQICFSVSDLCALDLVVVIVSHKVKVRM